MDFHKAALYIHIPFCTRKCDYCDFFSICDYSYCWSVVQSIIKQIERDMTCYRIDGFSSVYMGGGTPGSIDPALIISILEKVKSVNRGSLPEEVTLECNPENIRPSSLEIWRSGGVNRISMGVQSFQDEFLERAGRNSRRQTIIKALGYLKDCPDFSVSLDLIQGLPGMNRKAQLKDLQEAISFQPDHISWYSLSLEEGTVLYDQWDKRQNLTLEEQEGDRIWKEGCLQLDQSGYKRYEVSNFAIKGCESRHNRAYWKMQPYLGCGPGAVSMVLNEDGEIERHRVVRDVPSYAAGQVKQEDREIIEGPDFIKDFLLMGLRMAEGVDLRSFSSIFGRPIEECIPGSLNKYLKNDFLFYSGNSLRATPAGLDMLNTMLIAFFNELDGTFSAGRVNWPFLAPGDS